MVGARPATRAQFPSRCWQPDLLPHDGADPYLRGSPASFAAARATTRAEGAYLIAIVDRASPKGSA
jgi:hypothetical protein